MSKTMYYKIASSGPNYSKAPAQEPLLVNGHKVSSFKYSTHGDMEGSSYYTRTVVAVSFTEPPDYRTATYEEDHGDIDHSPYRAWSSTTVPDNFRPPPRMDQTDPSKVIGGGGPKGWFFNGDVVSIRDVNFLNSVEYANVAASVGDTAYDIVVNNVSKFWSAATGAVTQLKNAANVKALVTKVLTDQAAVIKVGAENIMSANPTMTPEQFAALGDRVAAQNDVDARRALENHTFLANNPAGEAVLDRAFGTYRLSGELATGQAGIKVNLTVSVEGFGANVIEGTISPDIIMAGNSGPSVVAGAGDDTVLGGVEDDRVWGEAGNNFFHGGLGTDTAVYTGVRRSYTTTATSVNGPEVSDRLSAVERIEFTDGVYAVGPGGALAWTVDQQAATAARVYDATLDRRPDAPGLKFWAEGLENGGTAKAMVDGFTASPEFQTKYGPLGNSAFVERIYLNVLDRPADAQGAAFWKDALDSGRGSRADVVLGFSESPENVARMAPFIDDGIWVA